MVPVSVRAVLRVLPVGLAFVGACARPGPPPGGPPDATPPSLLAVSPESLSVGVDAHAPLRLIFDEKIDRRGAARALELVPPVALARPHFDGTAVEFRPLQSWPADTVVVWRLAPDLKDKHGVALGRTVRGVFTTADSLPSGKIVGRARLRQPPTEPVDWTALVARLELPPPEGSRRRLLWREAAGASDGHFELAWLDVPSGPFFLEVFLDRNGNGRRDEREAVARVDSLFLPGPDPIFEVDEAALELVDLEAPTDRVFCLAEARPESLPLILWALPSGSDRPVTAELDTLDCVVLPLVPGTVRFGAWVDADGDRRWSADSTVTWEAFVTPDEFEVLPAVVETTRVRWPSDRLSSAAVDTLAPSPVPESLHSPPRPER